jgi:hypothetical protein
MFMAIDREFSLLAVLEHAKEVTRATRVAAEGMPAFETRAREEQLVVDLLTFANTRARELEVNSEEIVVFEGPLHPSSQTVFGKAGKEIEHLSKEELEALTFSQLTGYARLVQGLTQQQVVERMHRLDTKISVPTISKYESGISFPKRNTFISLRRALGHSPGSHIYTIHTAKWRERAEASRQKKHLMK